MQRTAFTEELVTVTINNVLPLETAHAFTSGFFDFVLICFYRSLITTLSSHLTSNKISKKKSPASFSELSGRSRPDYGKTRGNHRWFTEKDSSKIRRLRLSSGSLTNMNVFKLALRCTHIGLIKLRCFCFISVGLYVPTARCLSINEQFTR